MKPISIAIIVIVLVVSFISNIFSCPLEEAIIFERRGWESFQKRKYSEALGFFDKVLYYNPADIYLYSMRNYCYQEIILENRIAVVSLQKEISNHLELIERLQKDHTINNESTEALKFAILTSQKLALQLQEEIAKHDNLISILCSEISHNKKDIELLRNSITENKEILLELKAQFAEMNKNQTSKKSLANESNNTNTSLHRAIEANNWQLVEVLIESGHNLDSCELIIGSGRQKYNAPPAIRLALKANPSLSRHENKIILGFIKKIILNGANLRLEYNPCWGDDPKCEGNCITTQGNSLLIYSLTGDYWESEWIKIAELLLKNGVNPNINHGRSKWKPIQFALQMPTIEKVELLLRFGASLSEIDCFSWLGFTSVIGRYDAGEFKHIVQLLLANGADPHRYSDRIESRRQIEQCIQNIDILPVSQEFRNEVKPFLQQISSDWRK